MLTLFKPGDVVHGYCNGRFGRDDYETKTCIAVRPLYALFEYESGRAVVLNMDEYVTPAAVAAWKRCPEFIA